MAKLNKLDFNYNYFNGSLNHGVHALYANFDYHVYTQDDSKYNENAIKYSNLIEKSYYIKTPTDTTCVAIYHFSEDYYLLTGDMEFFKYEARKAVDICIDLNIRQSKGENVSVGSSMRRESIYYAVALGEFNLARIIARFAFKYDQSVRPKTKDTLYDLTYAALFGEYEALDELMAIYKKCVDARTSKAYKLWHAMDIATLNGDQEMFLSAYNEFFSKKTYINVVTYNFLPMFALYYLHLAYSRGMKVAVPDCLEDPMKRLVLSPDEIIKKFNEPFVMPECDVNV